MVQNEKMTPNVMGQSENCMICGEPLVYLEEANMQTCWICHREKLSNAACTAGHFVCDDCHAAGSDEILRFLLHSEERDPIALYLQVVSLPQIHLHGPEHHSIVPCVLLTAFHRCGGLLSLEKSLLEAWNRGKQIPGGACGFLGVCGAAAGAGIFASIVTGDTPLNAGAWPVAQELTARCLLRLAEVGGPRCCKRTNRLAIETAVEFAKVHWGVEMMLSSPRCTYSKRNQECIGTECPFFGIAQEG